VRWPLVAAGEKLCEERLEVSAVYSSDIECRTVEGA
jgi:hypothetical protein